MQGFAFEMEQRVVFRDIDMLGHVNNAVYATYFETARIEYLYAVGAEAAASLPLILAEITITYKSPAFLRERLAIGVRVAEIGNASFVVDSRIIDQASGRLVATSRAVIVHYDYDEKRAKPLPAEWRQRIEQFEAQAGREP